MGARFSWLGVALIVTGVAHGQPRTPPVDEAQLAYDRTVAQAELAFRNSILRAKQDYLGKVTAALKSALRSENLEEANRLDTVRKRIETEISSLMSGGELKATTPLPVVVATSGFNVERGLNVHAKNRPLYTVGEPVGKGGPEPGWSDAWRVIDGEGGGSDLIMVAAEAAKEGDAGARVKIGKAGQVNLARNLTKPQSGKFRIDQWIRSSDEKAYMIARPGRAGAFGPNWGIRNGHFTILAGKGDGSASPALTFNAFEFKPNVWYKVSVVIDLPRQTWEFYVDDKRYEPNKPLGFREATRSIEIVDYVFATPFDLDGIEVVQLSK